MIPDVTLAEALGPSHPVTAADLDVLVRPGTIAPVYQPIVRIADGEIVAYEALARVVRPVAGTPSQWFEAAHACGRSVELDLACLRAVAADGAPPGDRLLFVNVAPSSLGDPRIQRLADELPNRLVLELTEREAIGDLSGLRQHLAWWAHRGARVALDDTGAGYASLQQVVRLRPSFLKLDASLVVDIDLDRNRQALVAALATFAREVGATVIAEAVETPSQLAWLRAAGVTLAQGYLLAKPATPWARLTLTTAAVDAEGDDRLSVLERRLDEARSRREACEVVAEHLMARGGLMPSVYLHSAGRLRCYAQRGLWQVLDGMAPTVGITGRTFRTGRTQLLPDVTRESDYLEAIPGVVAEVCVPIRIGDDVAGALNVESLARLEASTVAEVEHCAALLGRALLTRPDHDGTATMRRLAAVASSLVALEDPGATASAVVAAACELAGTDSGAVLLGDVEQGFTVTHAAGPLEASLRGMHDGDLDVLARVLAPLASVYSSGDSTGLASVGGTALRDAGAHTVIALPLVAQGRRMGLLVLARAEPVPVGPEVVESLEVLATLAGSCLHTAGHLLELRTQATRDALTGLHNHALFHEALRHAGTERFSLALFDVDRFKQVNDTLGHLAGDRLLRDTATALAAELGRLTVSAGPAVPAGWPGGGPALFRVGGDELAALLPTTDPDEAVAMAEALAAAARAVLVPYGAGISGGTAVRGWGEEPIEALQRADAALYRAKATGGGVAVG